MADKTGQLIEIVKGYPILYDKTMEDYKSMSIKNNVWEEIAVKLHEKDVNAVRCKWKNLRDSFSKYLRCYYTDASRTSKHIDKYKSWPWVKQMMFLKPFVEFTGANSAAKCNSTTEERERAQQAEEKAQRRRKEESVQIEQKRRCTEDLTVQPVPQPQKATYDGNDLIFLGYSKTIKQMSLRRQACVKFEIAKIIMEAEIEHAEEKLHGNRPASTSMNSYSSQDYYINSPPEFEPRDSKEDTRKVGTVVTGTDATVSLLPSLSCQPTMTPMMSTDVTFSPPDPLSDQPLLEVLPTNKKIKEEELDLEP